MVRFSSPIPLIVTSSVTSKSPLVKVIIAGVARAKLISSATASAFARLMAFLSEPSPVSLVLLTLNVAA